LVTTTHVAIALAYDGATGRAPRVVAKGVDEAAHRLRRFAIAAGVPIVSNPPLARALLPVPLDREVPEAHYRAMAAVIAYVLSLRTRNRAT
jgi:flagellar biosynthetic protein FlhB